MVRRSLSGILWGVFTGFNRGGLPEIEIFETGKPAICFSFLNSIILGSKFQEFWEQLFRASRKTLRSRDVHDKHLHKPNG